MTEKVRRLWFVRRNQDVRGPFPTAAIAQFLLIGRLHKADEVSLDREVWEQIGSVPELVPHVMKADLTDPVNQSNLEASRHGADERKEIDRRQGSDPSHQDQRDGERRMAESAEEHALRQARMSKRLAEAEHKSRMQNLIVFLVLFVICGGLLGLVFIYNPDEELPDVDCNTPPAIGVNWSNCNFQGAELNGVELSNAHIRNANLSNASLFRADLHGVDLSYTNLGLANLRMTNLVSANLVGAVFKNSDLRGANLSGADLSYADLQGAQLAGVNLDGAKLDKTIWVDGQLCVQGSVGTCLSSQ